MTAKRLKVYPASKLDDGPMWRQFAIDMPDIDIVARWPFIHITDDGGPGWPENCAAHGSIFWQHDHDDVAASDVVLIYTKQSRPLVGALIEAGIGIALGKSIILVGDHQSFGTWRYHSSVKRVATLDEAKSLLRLMAS